MDLKELRAEARGGWCTLKIPSLKTGVIEESDSVTLAFRPGLVRQKVKLGFSPKHTISPLALEDKISNPAPLGRGLRLGIISSLAFRPGKKVGS